MRPMNNEQTKGRMFARPLAKTGQVMGESDGRK